MNRHRFVRCARDAFSRRVSAKKALAIITFGFSLLAGTAGAAQVLSSVVIRGASVYTAPQLFDLYRAQLGKPIDEEGAHAIAQAVAARYEHDGYSRPQLRIDTALVSAGVLRIDVFEARIADVVISGDPGPHLARLEQIGAELRGDGPVRKQQMQTVLRRMRSLPGLTLAANATSDAAQPNAYRLNLDTRFRPVSGGIRFTNRGTHEAGPNFVLGQFLVNGLLKGETSLGWLFGTATDYDEYHGLGVLANVGLGERGGSTSFMAYRSRSDPREAPLDRDDRYLRDRISATARRPLADSTASLSLTLDFDDLTIYRSGSLLRDERLRMLRGRWSRSWKRGLAVEYASLVEVSMGLNALGSRLIALDLAADPRRADFSLSRFTITRLASPSENWSIRVDGFMQQTPDVLPYVERFKIGGDRLGRGFEVAEIAGDQGLGAKVELRRFLPAAPIALGRASVYGYYDIGAAWKHDAPGRESAATAGFGFAKQGNRVTGALELAKPLTHADVEGKKALSLFVEVSYALR